MFLGDFLSQYPGGSKITRSLLREYAAFSLGDALAIFGLGLARFVELYPCPFHRTVMPSRFPWKKAFYSTVQGT